MGMRMQMTAVDWIFLQAVGVTGADCMLQYDWCGPLYDGVVLTCADCLMVLLLQAPTACTNMINADLSQWRCSYRRWLHTPIWLMQTSLRWCCTYRCWLPDGVLLLQALTACTNMINANLLDGVALTGADWMHQFDWCRPLPNGADCSMVLLLQSLTACAVTSLEWFSLLIGWLSIWLKVLLVLLLNDTRLSLCLHGV